MLDEERIALGTILDHRRDRVCDTARARALAGEGDRVVARQRLEAERSCVLAEGGQGIRGVADRSRGYDKQQSRDLAASPEEQQPGRRVEPVDVLQHDHVGA